LRPSLRIPGCLTRSAPQYYDARSRMARFIFGTTLSRKDYNATGLLSYQTACNQQGKGPGGGYCARMGWWVPSSRLTTDSYGRPVTVGLEVGPGPIDDPGEVRFWPGP
jgi:hypothetical protein